MYTNSQYSTELFTSWNLNFDSVEIWNLTVQILHKDDDLIEVPLDELSSAVLSSEYIYTRQQNTTCIFSSTFFAISYLGKATKMHFVL